MAVVFAALADRWAFARTTHVAAFYHVAKALKGAVVLAPPVFYLGVAEAHVVEKLFLELFHPQVVARLLNEVHDFAGVSNSVVPNVIALPEGKKHVYVVRCLVHI